MAKKTLKSKSEAKGSMKKKKEVEMPPTRTSDAPTKHMTYRAKWVLSLGNDQSPSESRYAPIFDEMEELDDETLKNLYRYLVDRESKKLLQARETPILDRAEDLVKARGLAKVAAGSQPTKKEKPAPPAPPPTQEEVPELPEESEEPEPGTGPEPVVEALEPEPEKTLKAKKKKPKKKDEKAPKPPEARKEPEHPSLTKLDAIVTEDIPRMGKRELALFYNELVELEDQGLLHAGQVVKLNLMETALEDMGLLPKAEVVEKVAAVEKPSVAWETVTIPSTAHAELEALPLSERNKAWEELSIMRKAELGKIVASASEAPWRRELARRAIVFTTEREESIALEQSIKEMTTQELRGILSEIGELIDRGEPVPPAVRSRGDKAKKELEGRWKQEEVELVSGIVKSLPPISAKVREAMEYADYDLIRSLIYMSSMNEADQIDIVGDVFMRNVPFSVISDMVSQDFMDEEDIRDLDRIVTMMESLKEVPPDREHFVENLHALARRMGVAEPLPSDDEIAREKQKLEDLPQEKLKDMYLMSQREPMQRWAKDLIVRVALARGVLSGYLPEPTSTAPMVRKEEYTYEDISDQTGEVSEPLFASVVAKWGVTKEGSPELYEYLLTTAAETMELPKYGSMPPDMRRRMSSTYLANIPKRFPERFKEVAEAQKVSAEKLAGIFWKEYGMYWKDLPSEEMLGDESGPPMRMTPGQWKTQFYRVLMGKPYSLSIGEVAELYREYGSKFKMPPPGVLPVAEPVQRYLTGLARVEDVSAVLKYRDKVERPLMFEDFQIALGDRSRALGAYWAMWDLTAEGSEEAMVHALEPVTKTNEDRERLKYLVSTDNIDVMDDFISSIYGEYEPSTMRDIARDAIKRAVLENQTDDEALKYARWAHMTPRMLISQIDAELEEEPLSIEDITSVTAEDREKWRKVNAVTKTHATAADLYMRYPEMSKKKARATYEALELDEIKETYPSGKDTPDVLKAAVGKLKDQVDEYMPGDDKRKLYRLLERLEQLDKYYWRHTGAHLVSTVDLKVIGPVELRDAKAFARGRFKDEFLTKKDYQKVADMIGRELNIPKYEALVAEFKDKDKAEFIHGLFMEGRIPAAIPVTADVIQRRIESRGISGDDARRALEAWYRKRILPKSYTDLKKEEDERRVLEQRAWFDSVLKMAVTPDVRSELIKLPKEREELESRLRSMLDKKRADREELWENWMRLVSERTSMVEGGASKSDVARKNSSINQAEQLIKQNQRDIFEIQDQYDRDVVYAPTVDYTAGVVDISHPDFYLRKAYVKVPVGSSIEKVPVSVTLADIKKWWVDPYESKRKAYLKKYGKEPGLTERNALEPSIPRYATQFKVRETHVYPEDFQKATAVVAFMNKAKELGSYAYEYEMAELSDELGMEDIPLMAYPTPDPVTREHQFKQWLRYSLKPSDIHAWTKAGSGGKLKDKSAEVLMSFIGPFYKECPWSGDIPTDVHDIRWKPASQVESCAMSKARVIQSQAVQYIEPSVLLPILHEVVERGPSLELERAVKRVEEVETKMKEEIKKDPHIAEMSPEEQETMASLIARLAQGEAKLKALTKELKETTQE